MAEQMNVQEAAVHKLLIEVADQQRAFLHNIEPPLTNSRRLLAGVVTVTVAGLVVGGLVGALLGTTDWAARSPGR